MTKYFYIQFHIIIMLLGILLCSFASSDLFTYYISNDKVEGSDGTYEKPWFFDWENVIRKIKRIGGGNDFELIFKEGDYYPTDKGYGITFTSKNSGSVNSLSLKPEEGKRVRIITASKLNNWSRSSISDKFWIHDYDIDTTGRILKVNNKRSTLCRAPSLRKYGRTINYSVEDDPEDSDYLIRTFEVQKDAIDMLKLTIMSKNNQLKNVLTEEEINDDDEVFLKNTNFVDYHYWTYSREKIIKVDFENNKIQTRVTKSEDSRFGVGKVRTGDTYHIENLLPALNEPGEFFVFPNNSILYYPRKDEDFTTVTESTYGNDNIKKVEVLIADGGIALHSTGMGNITVKNFELIGSLNSGLYMTGTTNLLVENITSHFCETGIYIANSFNVTVNHCLVEEIGGYGMNLRKNDYQYIKNNIIRGYGKRSYNCHGMWYYETCNNTIISNNDVGDGYHSPIQIFHKFTRDNITYNNILVKDNHVHHSGYGILDDMGGVTALFVAIGTVIDHNWAHDIYSPGYCGGCFLTGSGSFGIVMKNNLAYNASHNALKFDRGAEMKLYNNIMGYNTKQSVLIYTANSEGYLQWVIKNNIFIFDSTIQMGAFDDSSALHDIDYNIYWHINGPENINFRKKTWDYWRDTRGYDHNGYIVDPLFVSPENANYNFINDSSYKKIGFIPFSFEFGVTGEKEWIEKSKNYEYVSKYEIPDFWQFEGGQTETFENINENNKKEWSDIWKKAEIIDPSKVYVTNDKDKCPAGNNNGQKCLKFIASSTNSDDNLRPKITIPVDWYEGHAEVSFDLYQGEYAQTYLHMGDASYVELYNGKVGFFKKTYQSFPTNEWVKVKLNMNFGSTKVNNTFDFEINGTKQNIYYRTSFSKTTEIRIAVVNSSESTYIDNLFINIDRKHVKYFDNELQKTNSLTSIFNLESAGKEKPKKLSSGAIVGIVFAVIAVVVAIVLGVIFYLRKKNSNSSNGLKTSNLSL